MSRVGKRELKVPSGVQVTVQKNRVMIQGPRGALETPVPDLIEVELTDGTLRTRRKTDTKPVRALHGLTRSLLANAIAGVTKGFKKELDVVGVGYRADVRGRNLNLGLGFSHPVVVPIPHGIEIKVERAQKPLANYVATIIVTGSDKRQVGQMAADIRALRPPDSYKGKGIRYAGEVVRLKVGKKGA